MVTTNKTFPKLRCKPIGGNLPWRKLTTFPPIGSDDYDICFGHFVRFGVSKNLGHGLQLIFFISLSPFITLKNLTQNPSRTTHLLGSFKALFGSWGRKLRA